MWDMAPDHDAQAMLDDLRNGYGDRSPMDVAPVAAPVNARLRDWKRRSSATAPSTV